MLTLWFALQACAPLQIQGGLPLETKERIYDLRLRGNFSTRGEDGLQVTVPDQQLVLRGRVVLADATLYRDGSVGTVVLLEELTDEGTGLVHGLSGRAMELRHFPSGEVLEVHGLDHLAGPGRNGDALDILIPLFSPKIPQVSPGKEERTLSRYPVRLDEDRGHQVEVVANWVSEGSRKRSLATDLRYEGQLRCSGTDRELQVSCAGGVAGEIRRDRWGGILVHDLNWTRTVVLQGPGGTLVQEQVLEAQATRWGEGTQ